METTKNLISVIVAVKNGEGTIRKTIESFISQTYPLKELIIIDGNSNDKTRSIINEFEKAISYWESSDDTGIYHAWNKALLHVKGEWICFIGADDYFSNTYSLQNLFNNTKDDKNEMDLVIGKIKLIDIHGNILKSIGTKWDWEKLKRWQNVAHPGMLHNRKLFKKYGFFNETYKIAGDYDFLLRLGKNINTRFINQTIVHMGNSGLSNKNVLTAFLETRKIQVKHKEVGILKANINFLWALFKFYSKKLLFASSKPGFFK